MDGKRVKFELMNNTDKLKSELINVIDSGNNMIISEKLNDLINTIGFGKFIDYICEVAREGKNERLFEVLIEQLGDNPYEVRSIFIRVCCEKVLRKDSSKALETIEKYIKNRATIKNKKEYFNYMVNADIQSYKDGKNQKCSLLFYACTKCNYDVAMYLFKLGASNMDYDETKLALKEVCSLNRTTDVMDVIRFLVVYAYKEFGVDKAKKLVNEVSSEIISRGYILECIKEDNKRYKEHIAFWGGYVTEKSICESLRIEAQKKNLDVKNLKNIIKTAKTFLEKSIFEKIINSNFSGYTVLGIVCAKYDEKDRAEMENFLEFLIQNGAEVNSKNNIDNDTPLIVACRRLKKDMVETLLECGADINIINDKHETSLSVVCQLSNCCGAIELAKFLIDKGANINSLNSEAVINICNSKNDKMVCLLIKNGLNIDNIGEANKKILEEMLKVLKVRNRIEKKDSEKQIQENIEQAIKDQNEKDVELYLEKYLTFDNWDCGVIYDKCKNMMDKIKGLNSKDLHYLKEKIKEVIEDEINKSVKELRKSLELDEIVCSYRDILNLFKVLKDEDFCDFRKDIHNRGVYFGNIKDKNFFKEIMIEYDNTKEFIKIVKAFTEELQTEIDNIKSDKNNMSKFWLMTDTNKTIKKINEIKKKKEELQDKEKIYKKHIMKIEQYDVTRKKI